MLTLYEYQLALLDSMCDSAPAEAAAKLQEHSATRADTVAAARRFRSDPRPTLDDYVAAWGSPDSMAVEPQERGRAWRRERWNLTVWPDLQLELSSPAAGMLFRQLVRRPAHRSPRPDSPADLTPWSCTHSELAAGPLGPIVHVDSFGGIGDVVAFVGVDPKSRQDQSYWAHFDWSLLQFVDRAPETYVWQEP